MFLAFFVFLLRIRGKLPSLLFMKDIMNIDYLPNPVNTDEVVLPEELCALAESIAKNVHEVWAQNRMSEGWTYGPVRDDGKKQTPCLVAYEELPESEKAYDRDTAIGTLKYIVALGFDIVKK